MCCVGFVPRTAIVVSLFLVKYDLQNKPSTSIFSILLNAPQVTERS
jgi:hypothetical protein